MKRLPHPGELIRVDVLQSLGHSVTEAAIRLGVSRVTLSRLLNGHMGISPEMALRLERAGVNNARFWMAVQSDYELSKVDRKGIASVRPLFKY
ncbi:addiction module HigA family antidote [Advenella incenata]|uniref:Addiction module HigA family antidote n=1 Tax=Advenella incenata TaxID=267800 RepID=A0A4Q7VRB2_9BURK|nr:HigA family addiction module antitoxin [Advenella incenata]RZT99040.1 addiction module HigA family antidote [Advenella incenata]